MSAVPPGKLHKRNADPHGLPDGGNAFSLEKTETIHKGWTHLQRVTISDGNARQVREVEDHGKAAAVLPYDPVRHCVMLVRVVRAPLVMAGGNGWSLEAPAGLLDPGEEFEQAARREVLEETGLSLGALEPVATVWSSPGASCEQTGLFLASYGEGARLGDGRGTGADEQVVPVELTFGELRALIAQGRLEDLKTLTLALALQQRHPALFS